jgi:xanthine dehydrogenase accessory factor
MKMNNTLLKKIDGARRGLLVTILRTGGHTYKKMGEKALYEVDDPLPVCGNIGAGCVAQEILTQGRESFTAEKPRIVRIDTSDPSDIVFGHGTFCGGVIEVLIEPIFEDHKVVYRKLYEFLENGECPEFKEPHYLIHDLETGTITFSRENLRDEVDIFVEEICLPTNLYIFGATPLAVHVVKYLEEMDFRIHVIDWRANYLDKFEGLGHVRVHKELGRFDEGAMVLVLSHRFEIDCEMLKKALLKGCAYVGLLSSKKRRDRIFEELEKEGISTSLLSKVSSPVGIDINSRSDPEIAIGIVAEIIQFKNRTNDGVNRVEEGL